MMDEKAAATPAPPARSIGQRLRAGRERSGLSVVAAAEKLHLDPKVVEALEADRFGDLGASVYVRGHLRRYADFVGEPGLEMVESYVAREVRPPPPDLTQVPQGEHRSDPRHLVTPLVGVGCALVLALAIWWVLVGSQPTPAPSPAAPVAAPAPVQLPAVSSPGTSPPAALPSPESSAQLPASNTTVAGVTEPAAAQQRREETAPVRPTNLRLVLNNDSWVEVYDARGERLFFDVASAGSVQSVEGRAPLRVVLGSSEGVAVEVDGRRREIPSGAIDGEGARFVVNRSGSLARAR